MFKEQKYQRLRVCFGVPFFCFLLILTLTALPAGVTAAAFIKPGPIAKKIETVNGEKLGIVRRIIQGQDGFMWMATRSGLVRFDGYSIKRFEHDADNSESLPFDNISDLVQDKQGMIWLSTYGGGLIRFSPKQERFVQFVADKDNLNSLDSNYLIDMELAADGKLWLGSSTGLNAFEPESELNAQMSEALQIRGKNVRAILLDASQRLWVSVHGRGLYMHDSILRKTTHFIHDTEDKNSLSSDVVNTIYQSRDGTIWLGVEGGLLKFDPVNSQFIPVTIPLKSTNKKSYQAVNDLYEDAEGRLWIASSYNGLSVLLPGATQAMDINSGIPGKDMLDALHVYQILPDRSGNLWFVVADGLIKLKLDQLVFDHTRAPLDAPIEFSALFTDRDGQTWLGTSNALYTYDEQENTYRVAIENTGFISAISQLADGQLLVASNKRGIFTFDSTGGRAQLTPYGSNHFEGVEMVRSGFASLAVGEQNVLWVGLLSASDRHSGLYSFDGTRRRFVQRVANIRAKSILPVGTEVVIATDRSGLKIYNRETGQVFDIETRGYDVRRLWCLFRDRQGRIWLGSRNSGLLQLDLANRSIVARHSFEGSAVRSILSIAQDEQNNLWLGTNAGLVRFEPESNNWRLFDDKSGLRLTSFSKGMIGSTPWGDIIAANSEGLVRFSAANVVTSDSAYGAAPILSDFKLFDRSISISREEDGSPLGSAINHSEALELSHEQYRFSLTFASSDFSDPENTRYRYKLQGLHDHWIETGANDRVAAFTSLPANDYLFRLQASAPDGGWNENERRLAISVKPAFWATTTAFILYGVLAVLSGFVFNLLRIRQLKRRAEQLELGIAQRTETITRLLSDKDRLFANISHEFRTPLTLILGPLEAELEKVTSESSKASLNLAKTHAYRLLSMVEQLLDIARLQDTDNQQTETKGVLTTCRFLMDSYASLAEQGGIRLMMDNHLDGEVYVDMLPDTFEKIISNLLTNAIKYSSQGADVRLRVEQELAERVSISVVDTGAGIDEMELGTIFERFTRGEKALDFAEGTGIGLALVKELVERHQGQITVESELEVGSVFKVCLPLSSGNNNQVVSEYAVTKVQSGVELLRQEWRPDQVLPLAEPNDMGRRPHILIVEDHHDMGQYILSCLQSHYVCSIAMDGEAGIAQARELMPDLIITDVMMPKADGFEVTKCLRADEATNHIPIIMLTAHGDRQNRIKGWSEKVDEYLEKPFNRSELLTRIDNLLSIRALLRQRFQWEFTCGQLETQSFVKPEGGSGQKHKQFIDKVNGVLEKNYDEASFDVVAFSDKMALSSRQLNRKLNAVLGLSAKDVIRSFRLKKAAEFLTTGETPSVVAFQVGFNSHSYFSRCFKAQYNCMPSQFQNELGAKTA